MALMMNKVVERDRKSAVDFFESIPVLITREHRYGFRGQANEVWDLAPTLARFVDQLVLVYPELKRERERTTKLALGRLSEEFKRNLIVNNDVPRQRIDEMDLWQYGQHFGLPSPLLDWTRSPYVALFFALWEHKGGVKRCVWTLDLNLLNHLNELVVREVRPKFRDRITPESFLNEQFPLLEIVEEVNENNRRMTFQQGFFTKHDYYRSLEVWLKRVVRELHFNAADRPFLMKHTFPCSESERLQLLDKLDAMNINNRTLFPDIMGSVLGAMDHTTRSFQGQSSHSMSFTHLDDPAE